MNTVFNNFSNKGKEFYLFLKYNFFNAFNSRVFYGFLDRYLVVDFVRGFSFIYREYPENNFGLHLQKSICSQFLIFIYLINSSISMYKSVYTLRIVYVIINQFMSFRGNLLLLSLSNIILNEMYFASFFDINKRF